MTKSELELLAERARARATWPVRRYRLGEEPGDDLSSTTTATERLAMMWPLAEAAWAMSGRAIPDYPRGAAPGRIFRNGAMPEDAEKGDRESPKPLRGLPVSLFKMKRFR